MQLNFKKWQKTAKIAAGPLIAFSVVAATMSSPAAAESLEKERPKSSLFAVIEKWQTKEQTTAKIEPTAAKIDKTTYKKARAIKPPANEDITDDEIVEQDEADQNDPFEPLNRLVFGLNEVLDLIIFTPVSTVYRTVVPTPVRTGVSNVIANTKAPVTLVNDLLQGKPERARTTFLRFLINSTAGFGGFVDAAEAGGLPRHYEDFGQTLAVWGVGSGPYVVLPVFGPSTPRHIVGRVADIAATPTTWILGDISILNQEFTLLEQSAPTMADLVTNHEAIMDDMKILRKTSPDFYASVRDIYRQSRKNAISDGDSDDDDPLPEIPDE